MSCHGPVYPRDGPFQVDCTVPESLVPREQELGLVRQGPNLATVRKEQHSSKKAILPRLFEDSGSVSCRSHQNSSEDTITVSSKSNTINLRRGLKPLDRDPSRSNRLTYYYIERHDKRDRYSKCLITTLQSKPTTTYFWLRTQSSFIDGQIEPLKCLGVDTVPSVRFPKHGAILPLRPFQLCDSSFKSPWRLKSYCTSLNVQIGEVFEILTGQVVRSRVTTSDYSASFNIRIRKRLERTD